jgi:sulfur carrier protein
VILSVNGSGLKMEEGASVPDVLAALDIHNTKGLAVAVDGRVVPRSQWETLPLRSGMRVEVLRAVQGG